MGSEMCIRDSLIPEDLVAFEPDLLETVPGALPDLQGDRHIAQRWVDADVLQPDLAVEIAPGAVEQSELFERVAELVRDEIAFLDNTEQPLRAEPGDLDDLLPGQL